MRVDGSINSTESVERGEENMRVTSARRVPINFKWNSPTGAIKTLDLDFGTKVKTLSRSAFKTSNLMAVVKVCPITHHLRDICS